MTKRRAATAAAGFLFRVVPADRVPKRLLVDRGRL
jgi:hypothetical protein